MATKFGLFSAKLQIDSSLFLDGIKQFWPLVLPDTLNKTFFFDF